MCYPVGEEWFRVSSIIHALVLITDNRIKSCNLATLKRVTDIRFK